MLFGSGCLTQPCFDMATPRAGFHIAHFAPAQSLGPLHILHLSNRRRGNGPRTGWQHSGPTHCQNPTQHMHSPFSISLSLQLSISTSPCSYLVAFSLFSLFSSLSHSLHVSLSDLLTPVFSEGLYLSECEPSNSFPSRLCSLMGCDSMRISPDCVARS